MPAARLARIVSSDSHPSRRSARRLKGPGLEVHDLARGARHRLILSGELDRLTAHDLERAVCSVCGRRTRGLVLDLRGLTFIDLCGLRMVLFARELCEWQGCDFGLVSMPDNVQRAFEPANVLDLAAPILAGKRCAGGSLQSS
ncbi:MAG TPA: STAS domain-containing protein [Solirubrobacteraceae bacterium]|nr:STAS domain-containing protein [Solirubrobacteraceae bacterium]